METVNIYGHLSDKSTLVLATGNYNQVHGLMNHEPRNNSLWIRPLSETSAPAVLEFIVNYENSSLLAKKNKVYFSLAVKDPHGPYKYLGVRIEPSNGAIAARAALTKEKFIFTIDYSVIDRTQRKQLLAGALSSLSTTFGEKEYVVSWAIEGFSDGDLIMMLPTEWYDEKCALNTGIAQLLTGLQQSPFKGYTSTQWCEKVPEVTHCSKDKKCGSCLGPCADLNHVCYVNPQGVQNRFMCGTPDSEPVLSAVEIQPLEEEPISDGTLATWLAVAAVFLIIIVLAVGLALQYRNRRR